MSSYRHDGRIPRPRNLASQCRNVSPSATATLASSSNVPVSNCPGPLAKSASPRPAVSKAASFSGAEENRPILPPSSSSASSPSTHARQSFLPRPAGHSIPFTSDCPTSATTAIPPPSGRPMRNLPASRSDTQSSAKARPRNVLRRKPPTIGQHRVNGESRMDNTRPEKLSVVIPSSSTLGQVTDTASQMRSDSTELARQNSTPRICGDNIQPKISIPDPQAVQGPKELASLRTVNTQNLPPPTPSIPTASSPSTRYSGSPGIWSRTSTPTSLSSCSPGIVHSAKVGQRSRQPRSSQTRLPIFSPPMMSNPQSGRSGSKEPMVQNTTKRAESYQSPLRTELLDHQKNIYPSRGPPSRKFSTESGLPSRTTPDTEVTEQKMDEAERRVFEPRRPTRPGTAESSDSQAPARPSREGTHQLELQPSPVIQSNLSPRSVSSHKRRESAEKLPTPERPHPSQSQFAARSVDSLQSRSSSRLPSRTTPSPVMSRRSPQAPAMEENQKQEAKSQHKTRHFGLFPRKTSTEAVSDKAMPSRKGPAAGTGYEGYGKYGQPRRRSSTSSNGSGRSISTANGAKSSSGRVNRSSRPDLGIDDFLLDRLEPVVISGGGIDGASLSRAHSGESASGISAVSSNTGDSSKVSRSVAYSSDSEITSPTTMGEPGPADSGISLNAPQKQSPSGKGTGSDDGQAPKRHRMLSGKSSRRADERTAVSSQGIQGNKTSVTPSPQMIGGVKPGHPPPKNEGQNKHQKPGQKRKGLRWNFFQRSRGTEKKQNAEVNKNQLPVTISPVPASRQVAHYAFVSDASESLEDILQGIEESPPTEDEGTRAPVEVPGGLNMKKVHESVLLPSPPKMQGEFYQCQSSSPKVLLNKNTGFASNESPENKRRSRLEPTGRIPQVVSRHDREHKPAQQSFSRPFSITDSPTLVAPVTEQRGLHTQNNAELSMHSNPPPTKPVQLGYDLTQPFGDPTQASALDFLAGGYSNNEFLRFSNQTGSQNSFSSGSGGLSATTAGMPKSGTELMGDEVWAEYDDLIDNFSPDAPKSTGPRADSGEKFEMATMASKTLQAELNDSAKRAPQVVEPVGRCDRASSGSTDTVRLRRSRIISALQSPNPPSSQPSYSDIIAAYEDSENTDMSWTERKPTPKQAVGRHSSLLLPQSAGAAPKIEARHQQKNTLHDIAEGDRDNERSTVQTNLRSGSLMTSRWLSFGRVLFSPAHNHMKSRDQDRILVIDGLGNDDWSFYCSLTYPNAELYSLSMTPTAAASTNLAAWKPPINHHTIHSANLERSFPFPKGFFAVTVLRFPASCSENMQSNIVSECKRVLRPGGYMEMGILDLDMVKMGARTRKAVRKLKERTYLADPNISLKPASDNIQRLLGRHGLDNLRRCMVCVPVAGMIVRSSGSSSSTSASNWSGSARSIPSKSTPTEPDLSLGDLLSDPAPSASNDESIRKIVAKVARWWFSRCYEVPVQLSDNRPSIWADKKLLRECQKSGTGFRLLIAYAQKPSEKRRTASV